MPFLFPLHGKPAVVTSTFERHQDTRNWHVALAKQNQVPFIAAVTPTIFDMHMVAPLGETGCRFGGLFANAIRMKGIPQRPRIWNLIEHVHDCATAGKRIMSF